MDNIVPNSKRRSPRVLAGKIRLNSLGPQKKWGLEIKKIILLMENADSSRFIREVQLYDQQRERFASRAIAAGFDIPAYRTVVNHGTPSILLKALFELANGTILIEVAQELIVCPRKLERLLKLVQELKLKVRP